MPTYKLISKDGKRGLILECACHLNEHQINLLYWAKDADSELYLSPHLCPFPFWTRLWLGIKYILGYRSRYGDYAGLVLFKDDVQVLQGFLEGFLQEKQSQEKARPKRPPPITPGGAY